MTGLGPNFRLGDKFGHTIFDNPFGGLFGSVVGSISGSVVGSSCLFSDNNPMLPEMLPTTLSKRLPNGLPKRICLFLFL